MEYRTTTKTTRTGTAGKRRTPYEAQRRIFATRYAPQLGYVPVLLLPTEGAYCTLLPAKFTQQTIKPSARKKNSN